MSMSRAPSSGSASGSGFNSLPGKLSSLAFPMMGWSPWTEVSPLRSSGKKVCRYGLVVAPWSQQCAGPEQAKATYLWLFDWCTGCSCATCRRYHRGKRQSL